MFAVSSFRYTCLGQKLINQSAISAVRTLLSESYASPNPTDQSLYISEPKAGAPDLVSQCLSLDHCIERGYDITSSMIDRMVLSIEAKEHLEGSLYYLYKYRFSRNGYFLRPWTVHAFVKKCIDIDITPLTTVLNQKQYYGIFPDHYSLQLVTDYYLKENNIEDAFNMVVQMFLLEQLDNKTSQVLAMHVVSQYIATNSTEEEGGILKLKLDDLTARRNVAAILFTIGKTIGNASLTLIGQCLLGTIEKEHSMQEVYQTPWGPLYWEKGLLERTIADLQDLTQSVSQECIDVITRAVENDESLSGKLAGVCETLQSKSLISDDAKMTIDGIAATLVSELPEREAIEMRNLNSLLQSWHDDKQTISDIEQDIIGEYRREREAAFHEEQLVEQAHKMAVEASGFWDLLKDENAEKCLDGVPNYLHPGYVEGSMDELNIVERFRQKRDIQSDPVILMS